MRRLYGCRYFYCMFLLPVDNYQNGDESIGLTVLWLGRWTCDQQVASLTLGRALLD